MKRARATLCAALAALLLAGCGGQSVAGGGNTPGGDELPVNSIDLTPYTVVQALYPAYPRQPNEEDYYTASGDWDDEAYQADWEAFEAGMKAIGKWERIEVAAAPVLAFADKTAAQVFAAGENTVYSPVSLYAALAMLTELTAGDTRQQVMDLLGAADSETLRQEIAKLWLSLYCDDGRTTCLMGNAAFLSDTAPYRQEGLDVLADSYYASLYTVPMGTAEADEAVQGWLNQLTRGFLQEAAGQVTTEPDTLLMLINTLYYKAAWVDDFNESATEEDIFTAADGTEQTADFMHRKQSYSRYLRGGDYLAASLSLRGGAKMTFVLPEEGVTPESLLARQGFLTGLTASGEELTRSGAPAKEGWADILWSVPKFDVSSTVKLKDALRSLGLTDMFEADRADLTPLTEVDAVVSAVSQSARLKADEEGVEAAAFTLIAADSAAMLEEEPEVIEMNLNRPFLCVIYDSDDLPLFVAAVNTMA